MLVLKGYRYPKSQFKWVACILSGNLIPPTKGILKEALREPSAHTGLRPRPAGDQGHVRFSFLTGDQMEGAQVWEGQQECSHSSSWGPGRRSQQESRGRASRNVSKDKSSSLAHHGPPCAVEKSTGSVLALCPASCGCCPASTSAPSYTRRVAAVTSQGPLRIKAYQRLGTQQELHKCQDASPLPRACIKGR